MIRFCEEKGSSLIEIIAALILFSMVAAGLAIAIPMAYSRVKTWQAQFDVGRYLEKQLEEVRSTGFANLAVGDTGVITDPDDNNYKYQWVTSYVKDDPINNTWAASVPGEGDGLTAVYYDNSSSTIAKQVDPTIDFNWSSDPLPPSIPAEYFSVRWVGYVEQQYSEKYTFYVNADDGARLWVDNQLLFNQWGSPGEGSGTINLTANVRYPIKIEYLHSTGTAFAQLKWSSDSSVSKAIIPQSQLYSYMVKMTVVTVSNLSGTMSLSGRVITFDNVTATPEAAP